MNMDDMSVRAAGDGSDLDTAIEHARAVLSVLLRAPMRAGPVVSRQIEPLGWLTGPEQTRGQASYPKLIAGARALLCALLDYRFALSAEHLDAGDPVAIAAARADRDEAIEVTAALLYWLPPDDPSWPDVAVTLGRLSYDRYSDPWPGAAPPDPDDLDTARDLLLRNATNEADERTLLYLVLALRDQLRLMCCPADFRALATWSKRLLATPDPSGHRHRRGLSQADLQSILTPAQPPAPQLLHALGQPHAPELIHAVRLRTAARV
jgi:hypothetical protein